ncbi:SAM-dependent methyltransferase [Pilimelia anulata]|uniref:SAM-dependent methyltransferase n=1 Tax=Pilimelia anulata TaxID=53371 RepID=A0A8J3B4V8_9ACTN|nr:class I SAM-dependent methyltransferase [Pilimelia anulata]GGJ86255.1 SAM-dependent methyltransferase [Pilimelia anulata]
MTHTHLADMLDLDAEVLGEHHRDLVATVAAAVPERARIVDLGAGTGTGAVALARQLPSATVVAVDVDDEMLGRLRERAAAAGVADRIRTVRADVDEALPPLDGPADLVWASASLHHVADPDRVLAAVHAALRPGGLLAVTELTDLPRFLADTPDAAVEERGHAILADLRAEAGLHMHEDWAPALTRAGFTVLDARRADLVLRPPLPAAAPQYALVTLLRMRERVADRLPAADVAALDALAAGITERGDLTVRAVRSTWLARRP